MMVSWCGLTEQNYQIIYVADKGGQSLGCDIFNNIILVASGFILDQPFQDIFFAL